MGDFAQKPGGQTLAQSTGGTASGPTAPGPGKRTLTEDLPPAPAALRYDDMLAAVLAAQPLTKLALQGDAAARAQVFQLLAPVEARLSQLNDHRGRLAGFGAGNVAGQATLDIAETAIRAWRQRLALGTTVRTDELVLQFRAGAEPIRWLTGEAGGAPTLREFNRVSGLVGVAAATPVLAPALVALAIEEAPLLAFVARGATARVGVWALANPAAALAAAETLLGFGIQLGEAGWAAFWGQLDSPQGRWLFLAQVLMDFMHIQSGLHPEPPPDVAAARQRLINVRRLLQQVNYASTTIGESSTPETPGGARSPKPPCVGEPYPENPHEHVQQRKDDWYGAACGQMSAGRLGVEVDQAKIAATRYFKPQATVGHVNKPGGFDDKGLLAAMKEVAPIPGRQWIGGTLPQDISTPPRLLTHLKGYLAQTRAAIILRVDVTKHWIIVDAVTPDNRLVIRDPGEPVSTIVTAKQLSAMRPNGDAVLSFPENSP